MSRVVIIGAGPMGLYLALKLKKAGVNDIVIYDPRAGVYTRPGHINSNVFQSLGDRINEKVWENKIGHIKDIERILFSRVTKLNIPIEKKEFIGFSEDPRKKGVILRNSNNIEELVVCDYAFDCTGSKRALIHRVNTIAGKQVFTLNPISAKVNVKNHFLAYVKMSDSDLEKISYTQSGTFFSMPNYTPSEFTQHMEELRQMGWHELGFPKCYGVNFSKEKVCLYLECADNLPKELYEKWVQTVINAVTNSRNISFEQLPPTKNGLKKPRFVSFKVVPLELNQVAHQAPGLPMVIAMGDAQIDPNYFLAHGIRDGLERVDMMINTIEVYKGSIAYFDADEYLTSIQKMLMEHKQDIVSHYNGRSKHFHSWMHKAQTHYEQAILVAAEPLKTQLETTLREINARLNYAHAIKRLKKCHDITGKIPFTTGNLSHLETELVDILNMLLSALADLPPSFQAERLNGLEKLKVVANAWKEFGSFNFKKGNHVKAMEAYRIALSIYQNPLLAGAFKTEELSLQSNLVITYRKLDQDKEALKLAETILSKYMDTPNPLIKKKILFNFIKSSSILIEKALTEKDQKAAQYLSQDALNLCKDHSMLFDEQFMNEVRDDIKLFNGQNGLMASSTEQTFFSESKASALHQATQHANLVL